MPAKLKLFLFGGTVFLFFFLFFSQLHPLLPFDSDDWTFMSANRIALPSPRYWNPSRVMPEVLMPLFSGLAAYIIYPITGDYIGAQVSMHAIVVSLSITIYIYFFIRLIRNKMGVTDNLSLLYALLFLSFHFLIFRTADSDNRHLFYSHDLTCYYFYIIPNLLNAILVMSLLEHNWLCSNNFSPLKKGLIAVVVFLAICSNLYCSDIFVIFISCSLFFHILQHHQFNFTKLRDTAIAHWPTLAIILFWICINLMELMGPRSAYLADTGIKANTFTQIASVLQTMSQWRINLLFVVISGAAAIYGIFYCYKNINATKKVALLILASGLSAIYIVLVTSKVQSDYILRTDIAFSVVFPLLLLVMGSIVKASHHYSQVTIALPFILVLILSNINRSEPTFRDLRFNDECTINRLRRIDNDLINQMVKADQQPSADSVMITVPFVADDGKNWPYLTLHNNGYNSLSHTLYKHGLIHRLRPGKFVMGRPFREY